MFPLLLSTATFVVYGSTCIISLVITLSPKTYQEINEMLSLNIITAPIIVNPIEKEIDWIDSWFIRHNKIGGLILLTLSIIDLKSFFNIISNL